MPYYSNPQRFPQKSIATTKGSALRARAVCAVSLASSSTSASSSSRGAPTRTYRGTPHDNDAMEVDSVEIVAAPATIILPTLPTAIPFPPTPHSLLRSTLDNTLTKEPAIVNPDDSCGKENSTLPLRPRKRTRTTALLTNQHSTRPSSIPRATKSPHSPPSAKRPRTSPTSPEPSPKTPDNVQSLFMQVLLAAPGPATTQEPQPPSVKPSLDLVKSPFIQALISTPTIDPRLISPTPTHPAFFRHKRPTAGEVKILIHLYRSILYGIEFRFPDPFKTPDLPPRAKPKTPSNFDLEDSRLASQLQSYLTSHGITPEILTVDTEKITREALEEHQWATYIRNLDTMDIYDLEQGQGLGLGLGVVPSTLEPWLHPHLHTAAGAAVLSYENLVATLTMRYRLHPGRRRRGRGEVRRVGEGVRGGSPLIETSMYE